MKNYEEIGGYFEFELPKGKEYHDDALKFNSARNALSYLLTKREIKKLFVPYFIPSALYNTLNKANIEIEYYRLTRDFKAVLQPEEVGDATVLLINYYGICDSQIKEMIQLYKNVICNYAHTFFTKPEPGIDTIYSPRNFFGVSDGGYLYADGVGMDDILQDDSAQRYMARLVRIDGGPLAGNFLYRNAEQLLNRAEIRQMSMLTRRVLSSINYDQAIEVRDANFNYMYEKLGEHNGLNLEKANILMPVYYPFKTKTRGIEKLLASKRIVAVQLWPEIARKEPKDSFEYELATEVFGIPIDHRYTLDDMKYISDAIISYLSMQQRDPSLFPAKSFTRMEDVKIGV